MHRVPLLGLLLLAGCTQPRYHDLFEAAQFGDRRAIFALVEKGQRPNVRGPEGVTPLMIAAYVGNLDAARALTEAGAEVNAADQDGQSVLAYAAGPPGSADMVKFLVSVGASPSPPARGANTPLHNAAAYGDAETVVFLITRGSAVNVRNRDGYTPLLLAGDDTQTTDAEAAAVVTALLEGKADPDARLPDGRGAAELLIARGHADAAKLVSPPAPVQAPAP